MRFSYGLNRYDTEWQNGSRVYVAPTTVNATWLEYVALLSDFAAIWRHPSDKESRTPWTGAFILGDAEGRRLDNIVGSSDFISVDLDRAGWTLDRINERLDAFARILYTTTQSRPEHQRWRIITRLSREITCEEYGAIWRFMNDVFDGELDTQTKNLNRILYTPAHWTGADNIFLSYDGGTLDVDQVLRDYPLVLIDTNDELDHLDGTHFAGDIITTKMINDYISGSPGGRFWKLLCQVAKRHRLNNWQLTAKELAAAAMTISAQFGVKKRQNPEREAARALDWANGEFEPQTPWQKLQNQLRYNLTHNKKRTFHDG